jgi:hypothetical protein
VPVLDDPRLPPGCLLYASSRHPRLVLALPIEVVPLKVCNSFGSSVSGLNEVKGLRMVYTPEVAELAEPMALYFSVPVRST